MPLLSRVRRALAPARRMSTRARSEALALARSFIAIDSVSGNEAGMSRAVEGWLAERGWRVQRQAVEEGRDNLFATRPGVTRAGGPRLLFNTHLDTVPPHFGPSLSDDGAVLKGRGACDVKGLLACQLLAAERLVRGGAGADDVGLLYVVGEETDHCGMVKANELGLAPEALVCGEPTELKLMRGQKGMLKMILSTAGRAAHSGYPHLGEDALWRLVEVLSDLRAEPWPEDPELGPTTMNVGIMQGGQAANVVPDAASALLMFRVVDDPVALAERALAVIGDRADATIGTHCGPVALSVVDGFETDVAAFNTDIPFFTMPPGGRCFLYGPGSILDAHTLDEHVVVDDLARGIDGYVRLAQAVLQRRPSSWSTTSTGPPQ